MEVIIMMRAMYSGVSGLRVHQTMMDVIGNNIANVNTVGFKKSQVTFQEIYNETLKGAGSPQGGRAGTNPEQVGLGVSVAAINVVHSKGATQTTDNPLDLMIDGNGYFVVSNDVNAQNRFYTRAGNFIEDKSGYLATPSGYKLLDENMKPIQINKSEIKTATATTGIQVKGNINFSDDNYTTTADIYDSLGDVHTLTINFLDAPIDAAVSSNGTTKGSYRQVQILDEKGNTIFGYDGSNASTKRYVKFDTQGNFNSIVTAADGSDTAVNAVATISVPGADDISLTIDKNIFQDSTNNNKPLLTQTVNTSDAKGVANDGNSAGTISDYSISPNGEILGIFTNGEKKVLARIGLADFDNPAGLLKVGSNMFIDTPNSGTPKTGAPSSGSFGDLTPMALEMSNVDLSQEFTNMITTQRGFQANSRIITTTDEMLQELVNLKR
jgi:flagellar hook protein FlgE